jgi:hypothetical protein
MKKVFSVFVAVLFVFIVNAQDPVSAVPGVVYGSISNKGKAINVNELEQKIGESKYEGKVKGKVVEVCQTMGCWAKLEKEDGSTIMIKVKDHQFAMPKDIVGKTVIAQGEASVNKTSVAQLQHYAEDAGKSKEEIEKIKEPKMEVLMTIKGVKVVE